MSNVNIETNTIIFETNGCADEIKDALVKLGSIDADLSGENGDEYLWETAKKQGFETNAEYLATKVVTSKAVMKKEDTKGITAYTEAFAKEWLKHDSYYSDIMIDVVKLNGLAEDPNITGIYAFTVITEDYH